MKENQMFFWMMLSDLIATVILETMADSGVSPNSVTKEQWLEMSPIHANRRKAAADRIRQHGKEQA